MREKTLIEIEKEVNDFFRSDKCKIFIREYLNDTMHECHPPYRINVFLNNLNKGISAIDSRISIHYTKDGKSDLLFNHNRESVYLKYTLPNGEEEDVCIGDFIVDTSKSSIGGVCEDGSNLMIRFDSKYVVGVPDRGRFYTYTVYLTISDIIALMIKMRQNEIIKDIKWQIKVGRNSIKQIEKRLDDYNKKLVQVRNWNKTSNKR